MLEPVEYRPPRVGMGCVALLLLLPAMGGAWVLAGPGAERKNAPLGVVTLVLFGSAFFLALLPVLRPRAVLRLDTRGIAERGHLGAEIVSLPWSSLARVEPFAWRGVTLLALVPRDEARALAEGPPTMRRAARANVVRCGSPFVLDPRMYGRSPAELQMEIERRLEAAPRTGVLYPRP